MTSLLGHELLLEPVALALKQGGFRRPSSWASAVVVLRHGEAPRAALRGDFAGWLASNALPTAAHEATARKVPPGHVLVWLEIDVDAIAAARFTLFDFAGALARAAKHRTLPAAATTSAVLLEVPRTERGSPCGREEQRRAEGNSPRRNDPASHETERGNQT